MKKNIFNSFKLNKANTSKYLLTGLALLLSLSLFAQEAKPTTADDTIWLFSNGLFLTLLAVIILLIIIIAVLGGVLKNVAQFASDRKKKNTGTGIGVIAFIIFISSAHNSFAQSVHTVFAGNKDYMGLGTFIFFLMIAFIVLELIIVAVLISMIQLFVKREEAEKAKIKLEETKNELPSFIEKLNASVSLENEKDILLDHNYDGIQELDNDLPPWWKYGFYITIIFAVIYLIHYHVIRTGDLQLTEYNKTIQAAHEAKEAYQKMDANNVTEGNVKMISDVHELEEAAKIFKENCAVCHGKFGEGGVGPNMTDDYWLHGGSIKNLFVTIKYGWPDKGMKSWQADFTPIKMAELASYIKTLKGTNPPNQKAPQGDLYKEEMLMQSDTAQTDSLKVISSAIDSSKAGTKK